MLKAVLMTPNGEWERDICTKRPTGTTARRSVRLKPSAQDVADAFRPTLRRNGLGQAVRRCTRRRLKGGCAGQDIRHGAYAVRFVGFRMKKDFQARARRKL